MAPANNRSKTRPEGWSRREAVAVTAMRELVRSLVDETPDVQRARLATSAGEAAFPVTRKRMQLGGRAAMGYIADVPERERHGTVLHFHSGGYVVGSVDQMAPHLAEIAHRTGAHIISLDYRLAPENPFPAALEDAQAALEQLLDDAQNPDEVVLMGDSAGGGLALAATCRRRDSGRALPSAIVLGSPWVDLRAPESEVAAQYVLDVLPAESLGTWASLYLAKHSPEDPLVSPVLADLSGLPPLFVTAGEYELPRPAIEAFVASAERAGNSIEYHLAANAVHCWYMTPAGLLPGPSTTLAQMSAFIVDQLAR